MALRPWTISRDSLYSLTLSKAKVILQLTVSLPVCLGVRHPSDHDYIYIIVRQLQVCWCWATSLMRGGLCSLQLLLSLACAIDGHTLLLQLRLPQPGGPGSPLHFPKKQGRTVIPPGTEFWSFTLPKSKLYYNRQSVGQPSWYQAPIWDPRPIFPLLSSIFYLQFWVWAFLRIESNGTHENSYCLYFWDSPNQKGQVPVFISAIAHLLVLLSLPSTRYVCQYFSQHTFLIHPHLYSSLRMRKALLKNEKL
jgi:hypothetical protein